MSQRYSRLFVLTPNLYVKSSPIIIVAGALYQDNIAHKRIAQLKFKSISIKTIRGVRLTIKPLDIMGKPLGETKEHSYLCGHLRRGEEYGQNIAIELLDAICAFDIVNIEAIFEDGSTWSSNNAALTSLGTPVTIERGLKDTKLVEAYRRKCGLGCKYVPMRWDDLWYCTCGAWNTVSESKCHACSKEYASLDAAMDLDALKVCAAQTETAIRRNNELIRSKQKRRQKTIVGITAIAAVLVIVMFAFTVLAPIIAREKLYNMAVKCFENKEYENARNGFKGLDNYKDSKEQLVNVAAEQESTYTDALKLFKEAKYDEAREDFIAVGDYKDSLSYVEKIDKKEEAYKKARSLFADEKYTEAIKVFRTLGDYKDSNELLKACWNESIDEIELNTIYAGFYASYAILSDGTIACAGNVDQIKEKVAAWDDIISITAGYDFVVGLKSDGTAVSAGSHKNGRCSVSGWEDIVAISSDFYHTVGLKSDGTVVATGDNKYGECSLGNWYDIISISAGGNHTVGLKSDGTVVAKGSNNYKQCDVGSWENIIAIAACNNHTVGLKSDGTVVATGWNDDGQCDVGGWTDIIAISAGACHTVGLKSDGTVVATGLNDDGQCDVEDWSDIVEISANGRHTIGLKSDGTAVAVGWNNEGQCNVSDWKNIRLPNA